MKKVNVGEIYLSEGLIEKIEAHRQSMIEAHPDQEDMIKNSSFGMLLSDYLMKYVN